MKQKSVKKVRLCCPECGSQALLRPASVVHGEDTPGMLYVCGRYPACDNYVSAHRESLQPMGTLANAELRRCRTEAHRVFGALWRSGLMEKRQAYEWMQARFALPQQYAHIGLFSFEMCTRLICACQQFLRNNRIRA